MAELFDRVKESCSAPGTGTVTLLGAVQGFRRFGDVYANGESVPYCIADRSGANWEVGVGVWNTGHTLTRTAGGVEAGSAGAGVLANFASGTQDVFVTAGATFLEDLLSSASNLSDVANAGTARANLGLGTLATLSTVTLTSDVTGVLPVANGGTGATSLAAAGAVVRDSGGTTVTAYDVPVTTADGYPTGWVVDLDPQDLVGAGGADNTPVSSWSGGVTFTQATGAAQPTLRTGANGLNNKPIVTAGSGKFMQAASGGASLTGDWYVAAVVKPSSLGAYQWFLMWGDESPGERRGFGVSNANRYAFNGYANDLESDATASTSAWALVEFSYDSDAGILSIYVNGSRAAYAGRTFNAFASAVLTLFSNNTGASEFWTGSLARLLVKAGLPTFSERARVHAQVRSDFGLTVTPDHYTGMVVGQIRATTGQNTSDIHHFKARGSASGERNVIEMQQTIANGYSVIFGKGHDVADGQEGYGWAGGWGNTGGIEVFAGRGFVEVYNLAGGPSTYLPFAIIQTGQGRNCRRIEIEADGDIVCYRREATWPNEVEAFRVKVTGQVRYFPLASDPASPEDGDVWYNSTDDKLRVRANGITVDLH